MFDKKNIKDYYRTELGMVRDKMDWKQKYKQYVEEDDVDYTYTHHEEPKTVIIMRGLPGSGKSTHVRDNFPDAVVASADDFFVNENGDYVFVRGKIGEAHQSCWTVFINAVFNKERNIVVDNTNMCGWEYTNYVLLARKMGYEIQIHTMKAGLTDDTKLTTLLKRNSHGVDLKTIKSMKERFEPDFGEIYV